MARGERIYKNRKEGAAELALELKDVAVERPLVVGVPRGGVETGYYIARELGAEFTVVVARKLGHPLHPEAAFGALAEDGTLYLDPRSRKLLTKDMIETAIARGKREIERRVRTYRKGRDHPALKGRTVILADDGIATGSTLFALIEMCRKKGVKTVVVAAPVSAPHAYERLRDHADVVVVPHVPSNFGAVSQYYRSFPPLNDQRVLAFLQRSDPAEADPRAPGAAG